MVLLGMLYAQAPQPQDLMTFQWIVITALVSVIVYLFRQLRGSEREHIKSNMELLEKTLTAVKESNEVINGLVNTIEVIQQQLSIREEIERLRRELHDSNEKT